jgi:hypothetical protein
MVAAGVALALAAGCGGGGTPENGRARYRADGTVLEAPGRGAMLCFGVDMSLPPGCSGPPITNWDWNAVGGEQSAQGVTWGDYRVVGTWDGRSFTLVEPPTARPPAAPARDVGPDSPCDPGEAGWRAPEPARATPEHLERAVALARSQPDLAGVWIDDPSRPRADGTMRHGDLVLNTAFTGDIERHTERLRAVWGGALCVPRHERTLAELQAVIGRLGTEDAQREFGVLRAAVHEPANVVEVGVILATPELQAALDARFGHGVVRAEGALQPV